MVLPCFRRLQVFDEASLVESVTSFKFNLSVAPLIILSVCCVGMSGYWCGSS